MTVDELTNDQQNVLIALYGACAVPGHFYRTPLYKLRDQPPYADGRTVTSVVRRGFVERIEPEPPFSEPSYKLTEKGVALRESWLPSRAAISQAGPGA